MARHASLGTAAAVAAVGVWGFGNSLIKYIPLIGPTISLQRLWLGAVLGFGLVRVARRRFDRRMLQLESALTVTPVAVFSHNGLAGSGRTRPLVLLRWLSSVPGSGHLLLNYAHRYVRLSVTSLPASSHGSPPWFPPPGCCTRA